MSTVNTESQRVQTIYKEASDSKLSCAWNDDLDHLQGSLRFTADVYIERCNFIQIYGTWLVLKFASRAKKW